LPRKKREMKKEKEEEGQREDGHIQVATDIQSRRPNCVKSFEENPSWLLAGLRL
jgi:hypothetical protein